MDNTSIPITVTKKPWQAIETLGELLPVVSKIMEDEELKKMWDGGSAVLDIASYLFKTHAKECHVVIAGVKGVKAYEYTPTVIELFKDVLEVVATVLSNQELISFFVSVAQKEDSAPSGNATGFTQVTETM